MALKITSSLRFALCSLVFVFLTVGTYPVVADERSDGLDLQLRGLAAIQAAARDFCAEISTEGGASSRELSGAVKAKLNGLVGKVVDLGLEGGAKYKEDSYKNVLQKDLAEVLKKSVDCRLEVLKLLQDKLIPAVSAVKPPAAGVAKPNSEALVFACNNRPPFSLNLKTAMISGQLPVYTSDTDFGFYIYYGTDGYLERLYFLRTNLALHSQRMKMSNDEQNTLHAKVDAHMAAFERTHSGEAGLAVTRGREYVAYTDQLVKAFADSHNVTWFSSSETQCGISENKI